MNIFNICFTGISGSGKTTIANALNKKLAARNIRVQIIDGDETRKELGNLFGYTHEERMNMSKVNRLLAKYLNQNGVSTLIVIVAPLEKMRSAMREYFGKSYIEVYVKCSYETCVRRDVKGYYQLEKEGLLENFNGTNDIYEIPCNPDITVDTDKESVDSAVDKIIDYLVENRFEIKR